MIQNQEFIQEFVEEALTHVESVESQLLSLDVESVNTDIINTVFRAVHSIKGTAGFFGLKNIIDLSHSMENIFGEVRNDNLKITPDMVDLLLSANDLLKSMIENVFTCEDTDITQITAKLSNIMAVQPEEAAAKPQNREIIVTGSAKKAAENKKNELIQGNLKHGHRLYVVKLRFNQDLGTQSPIAFFNKVESIGTIIESRTDISSVKDIEHCLQSDITFVFIFTTVLEKSLLPLALEIPQDNIHELDVNTKNEDYSKIIEGFVDVQLQEVPQSPSPPSPAPKATAGKGNHGVVEDSIRVHVSLLNNLLNLASEMVLGRNQLLRTMDDYRKSIPGIDAILQNIDRITTELQENIMHTRMQPISNIFSKFPRIIRDLSKKLGKEIDLGLEGTDVELDKSIIEALTDPLTHLVRNAADHGLEDASTRASAGKPPMGKILMKAYHEGGYVNIDIQDDGKGIDIEKIKKKALEKDLVNQNELSSMTEQETLHLLFKPGFSTAEKITDVSGRGVGMDVVKTNIEKLGGTVEIFTEAGRGSTFRLLLPLTLAIIPSLIVEVENQKFALPQVNLQEIVRIKPEDASRKIEYIYNAQVLRLRDRLLPIVHLADVLGLQRTYIDPVTKERKVDQRETFYDQRPYDPDTSNIRLVSTNRRKHPSNIQRILVLKMGSKKFGVAVDQIHGSEEILVKPLPKCIKECKCYSGVTILGDGKTSMILDPEGIIEKEGLRFIEEKLGQDEKNIQKEKEDLKEQQNLLLFKCSDKEMFAMDLSLVSRVEEITLDEIEKVGEKEYIKFQGDSLRVLRLPDFLPVTKSEGKKAKLYVIIPKLVKHPLGILVEEIYDTIQTTIKLNEEDVKVKGLMGSTILNNKLILLLNLYELFELADPENYRVGTAKTLSKEVTVLIAEDTPFFRKLEKSYLEAAGYHVLTAQDGREALQILQERNVDVVVSDIHMPVMDGLEFVKKIREDKHLSSLPVIAITSMTGKLQKQAGLDAGFDFYEFKLDRSNLLQKVELVLQQRGDAP